MSATGSVRASNQDAIQACDPTHDPTACCGYLYALADGMGGYEHGDMASALALQVLFERYYAQASARAAQSLRESITLANLNVYQAAQRLGTRMGTTLTAVSVVGNRLHIAHVGDSRAYLVRHAQATCLTNDHTMVGDLVRMKVIPPSKVRNHSQRSMLNRCLGLNLFVQPDLTQSSLQRDDTLILCSDGVWAVIEDDEFGHLAAQATGLRSLSENLINLALDRKSDDNVSVVAIHIRATLPEPAAPQPRRTWRVPSLFGGRVLNRLVHP
jgi:PPM family protein phosphatase